MYSQRHENLIFTSFIISLVTYKSEKLTIFKEPSSLNRITGFPLCVCNLLIECPVTQITCTTSAEM